MNSGLQTPAFFIGWDVGRWNCDKNGESRDAIVINDASLAILGLQWPPVRTSIHIADKRPTRGRLMRKENWSMINYG